MLINIKNIDTGETVRQFLDISEVRDIAATCNVSLIGGGNTYLLQLRECDFIEIIKFKTRTKTRTRTKKR
jgi:hypothetical protein